MSDKNLSSLPLVTLAVLTYNQEHFVRETVRAALAQTYPNLEIIISDDCSSDSTWEVINKTIQECKQSIASNKTLIINRNENNMGIGPHMQKVLGMVHGAILVANGGDDLSMPERIDRIVAAWLADGRKATVIVHDAWTINANGNRVGSVKGVLPNRCILGAMASYLVSAIRNFPAIEERCVCEDVVFFRRALLSGRLLHFSENLLEYRINVGVSNFNSNFRNNMLRMTGAEIQSYEQALKDLYSVQNQLSYSKYVKCKEIYEKKLSYLLKTKRMYAAQYFMEKCKAFFSRPYWFDNKKSFFVFVLLLLPNVVADKLLNYLKRKI